MRYYVFGVLILAVCVGVALVITGRDLAMQPTRSASVSRETSSLRRSKLLSETRHAPSRVVVDDGNRETGKSSEQGVAQLNDPEQALRGQLNVVDHPHPEPLSNEALTLQLTMQDGAILQTAPSEDGWFYFETEGQKPVALTLISERYRILLEGRLVRDVQLDAKRDPVYLSLRFVGVCGRVRDSRSEPEIDASVRITWTVGGPGGTSAGVESINTRATTVEEGLFHLTIPQQSGLMARVLCASSKDVSASELLQLGRPLMPGEVLDPIVLPARDAIAIEVLDAETGQGVSGAAVSFEGEFGDIVTGEYTDDSGMTTVALSDGVLKVVATASGYWPAAKERTPGTNLLRMTLQRAGKLELSWKGPVEATKVEVTGLAVASKKIGFSNVVLGEADTVRESFDGSGGVSLLFNAPESRTLLISEGRGLSLRDSLIVRLSDSRGLLIAEQDYSGIPRGSHLDKVFLSYSAPQGEIRGRVVWQNGGEPGNPAIVKVKPRGGRKSILVDVDASGVFALVDIPYGEYRITVRSGNESGFADLRVPCDYVILRTAE